MVMEDRKSFSVNLGKITVFFSVHIYCTVKRGFIKYRHLRLFLSVYVSLCLADYMWGKKLFSKRMAVLCA